MTLYPWFAAAWAEFLGRLQGQRLAHGLLLVAEPGAGIADFGRAVAARLLCATPLPSGHACGTCTECRLRMQNSHPDFFSVGLEANPKGDLAKVIKIDQIRELNARMALTAQRATCKVALIEPADQLNVEAANALLKTLEEPPRDSYLLLVSAYPRRLPATILSRCQRLALKQISADEQLAWLRAHLSATGADVGLALALAVGPLAARDLLASQGLRAPRAVLEALVQIASGKRGPVGLGAELTQIDLETALGWVQTYLRLAQARSLGMPTTIGGAIDEGIASLAASRSPRSLSLLSEQLQRIISSIKAPLKHDLLIDAWAAELAPPL